MPAQQNVTFIAMVCLAAWPYFSDVSQVRSPRAAMARPKGGQIGRVVITVPYRGLQRAIAAEKVIAQDIGN
jgi:hypothetical protein